VYCKGEARGMSPIRILRFKRPPGQMKQLQEIREKLREFVTSPPPLYGGPDPDRCIGCGKFGTFMCPHCREIQNWTLTRVMKLQSTIQGKFAARI
jgi:hypothetical protein